ncbi:MAG: PKD domain-containing protein [Saprospiraceae bacterium]
MRRVLVLFFLFVTPLLLDGQAFITTWRTTSANESITIPTTGGGYNYTINWGDGNTNSGQTSNATHTYASAGDYQVNISGDFPRIYFNYGSQRLKIIAINQWGTQVWSSMESAFEGCQFLGALNTQAMFSNVTLSPTNYDNLLIAWNDQNLKPNVIFSGGNSAGIFETKRFIKID